MASKVSLGDNTDGHDAMTGKQRLPDKEAGAGQGAAVGGGGGKLVPLKTVLELGARDRFVEAWVVKVPLKKASGALE